ncbi:RNA-binding region-containing protein 3 [Rhinatrema bivittatum]|uniref:RNA-binding region-containing protein 3 n=1 Tax=Rhinatrema bivittatum TaxID=194408 RepID=UPI00112C537C|nr:RNA-binding region-containing protein 3 [Rhinatrema bivittatum]XP_029473592.1 RNA-binding region-containing protein 3 [Rhinatrema bivittatum]XP_029473593.1 RNA-binding region-containing protein 3 [Rhinatrema bivittatum]XP_029473594.1 RNA-binding region-containing protein 3 [Rhinatrema bivittatum]XP_029473595.1 RNA-binding region-containing protein 3 [Rhinatrema bivittatum]
MAEPGKCQVHKSRTLLVRHLPAELTYEEKEDLLKYFGAASVRVFSDKGRLKHTAFATFSSENVAAKALSRLHQLKLLGHSLVVEFAKGQDHVQLLDQPTYSEKKKSSKEPDEEERETKEPQRPTIESGIAPSHGLTFPLNSFLKYLYPPPSNTVLTNIANALASVPKFYVQVLHLMNKMNLPTPFGPMTARPPTYEDYLPVPVLPPPIPPFPPEDPPLPEDDDDYDMQVSSREESEYESGDEEDKERMTRLMKLAAFQPKRPQATKKPCVRKRQKIKDLLNMPTSAPHSNAHPTLLPSDVFEQSQQPGPKKIEFHIPADMPAALENEQNNGLYATAEEIITVGFGKIYPSLIFTDKEESEDDDDEMPSEFISRKELEKGRISKEEMEKFSAFKHYQPGDPNCRIYVKNLGKQVQEKDLKFIFGRYVDFSSETEKIMFDIRLMKEGRMKGQAFIGLPNEKAAAKALKETNGYFLYDKPMVVQFARSARPKENSKDSHRKK